jgi:DNA transformation protein
MTDDDTPTDELPNLGPTSAAWLAEAGIRTLHDLTQVGVVAAYLMVRQRRPEATLNLLYALHGAVTRTSWAKLSAATKADLKRQVDEHFKSGS